VHFVDCLAAIAQNSSRAEQAMPISEQPLLTALALHEGYVDGDYLAAMGHQVDAEWSRPRIDGFLRGLAST